MRFGRTEILTDEKLITPSNVIEVLKDAISIHSANAQEIDRLIRFEKGEQPIIRKKLYRPNIDIQVCDNVANEITEFKVGYIWGNPITLVQRGEENLNKGIQELNNCYDVENINSKTQQLGRFVEICGIGYTYVSRNSEYVDGDSLFTVDVLDPRNTFVVKSAYYTDKRPMLAAAFREDKRGNRHFTCFSNGYRFEINGNSWEFEEQAKKNPLGIIPIVEWIRDYDGMGCFERQIDEMNNLNLLISDYTNDVDQNTQAIWHGNDVEFPKDANGNAVKPDNNDWLLTYTPPDGKSPFVKPLAVDYDYNGMLSNIISRRELILQKCNVPKRNSTSGGSSGIAMSDASGWSSAETSASKQQAIMEMCKMQELKVVLAAIKNNPLTPVDSPLLGLRAIDIVPSIKRSKTYELTTKINGLATLISHGFALEDALSVAPLFEDNNQVALRSGEGVRKYQETIFDKGESSTDGERRPFPDMSDQEGKSPMLK